MADAQVWWFWEETCVHKVVSSNPSAVYWMFSFSQTEIKAIVYWSSEETHVRKVVCSNHSSGNVMDHFLQLLAVKNGINLFQKTENK